MTRWAVFGRRAVQRAKLWGLLPPQGASDAPPCAATPNPPNADWLTVLAAAEGALAVWESMDELPQVQRLVGWAGRWNIPTAVVFMGAHSFEARAWVRSSWVRRIGARRHSAPWLWFWPDTEALGRWVGDVANPPPKDHESPRLPDDRILAPDVVWLGPQPLTQHQTLNLRVESREWEVKVRSMATDLDPQTGRSRPALFLRTQDVGPVTLEIASEALDGVPGDHGCLVSPVSGAPVGLVRGISPKISQLGACAL